MESENPCRQEALANQRHRAPARLLHSKATDVVPTVDILVDQADIGQTRAEGAMRARPASAQRRDAPQAGGNESAPAALCDGGAREIREAGVVRFRWCDYLGVVLTGAFTATATLGFSS